MYNFLFCSAGRRVKLIEDFRNTIGENGRIIVADNSIYAPARYAADKAYTVPTITDTNYIDVILDICKKEKINVVLTLIEPEIELLAKNKEKFKKNGITVLVPSVDTAELCFDKYKMYKCLKEKNISTTLTYGTIEEFEREYTKGKISFPVFVKPRTGSGSVGAKKVKDINELKELWNKDETLIAQEFMDGVDLDVDVYIDTISKKPVAMFSKKKIETKIGGASKTISFKDEKLFENIKNILQYFDFCGTIDMDFFYKNGEYFLSEINPRFGGAYIHAYGAGVDFPKLIMNNIDGIVNEEKIGNYEDDIMMLMYDDVIIEKLKNE